MTTNRNQTFYYHVGRNDRDEFQVKVRLRNVASSIHSDLQEAGNSKYDNCVESTFYWQQKIMCPLSKSYQAHSSLDPSRRVGELENKRKGASDKMGPLEEAFIYTYTDNEVRRTASRFGDSDASSHLSKSIHYLPIHNLHVNGKTLEKNSLLVHDRLSREDPFEIMYIVAAVDCRVQNDVNGESVNKTDHYQFHEEILCTMKLYQSGILEVTPGFSNIEAEDSDHDGDIFVDDKDLENATNNGPKLTTFTFLTPLGSIYQYTLEWVDFIIDEDMLEALALKVDDERYEQSSRRKYNIASDVRSKIDQVDSSLLTITGEDLFIINFESLLSFRPRWKDSSIRIDYEIILPKGYRYTLISGSMTSIANCRISGSTGLTKLTSPKRNSKTVLMIFLVFALVQLAIVFEANMVAIISVAVLALVSNVTSFGTYTNSMHLSNVPSSFHPVGHQICICRQKDSMDKDSETNEVIEAIKVHFQICSRSDVGKCTVDGYGSLTIPSSKSGQYTFDVRTFKLIRSPTIWIEAMYRIYDSYFGCSVGDLQGYIDAFDGCKSCQLHHTIKSEASGAVQIVADIKKASRDRMNGLDDGMKVKRSIEKVLSKVRRQKRVVMDYHETETHVNNGSKEMIDDNTKALLSRVRQRKEERKEKLSLDN